MYSIASSQAMHPDNVQTTVRVVRYEAHGRERQGLASGHMGDRAPVGSTLPIFLHANANFRLPEDTSTPVIMIGPGTGIAPFRAFLEERQATGQTGDNWLFFGEQRRSLDFLYQEQFEAMHRDGLLTRLDTAFSRDQAKKVYVQDRMAGELRPSCMRGWSVGPTSMCAAMRRVWRRTWSWRCWMRSLAGRTGRWTMRMSTWRTMKKQKRYQRDVY